MFSHSRSTQEFFRLKKYPMISCVFYFLTRRRKFAKKIYFQDFIFSYIYYRNISTNRRLEVKDLFAFKDDFNHNEFKRENSLVGGLFYWHPCFVFSPCFINNEITQAFSQTFSSLYVINIWMMWDTCTWKDL